MDIILWSPPRFKSSSTISTPLFPTYPEFITFITSPKEELWNSIANNPPNIAPAINPGIAGIFLTTRTITTIGGIKSHGVILKFVWSPLNIVLIWVISNSLPEYLKPSIP